jgi:hypothetical protein
MRKGMPEFMAIPLVIVLLAAVRRCTVQALADLGLQASGQVGARVTRCRQPTTA